jgi:hypothetical protein
MKKLILTTIFLLAVGGIFAIHAQPKNGIRIGISQEKQIVKNKLNLRFLDMVEDSRCPKDAQCIWAGNAKIKVQISKPGGTPKIFELNTTTAPESIRIEGYEIKLIALTPEPGSNIRIRKDGYVATFAVTKRVK